MSDHDIIDVEFTEVRARPGFKMIWADRIALVIGILLSCIGALYAYSGIDFRLATPDEIFLTDLKVAWIAAAAIFLVGRCLDFVVTGRIRT